MLKNYISPDMRYGEKLYDYAEQFRSIALLIDHDPTAIERYFHLPAIQFLLLDRESTAIDRTQYLEALSYGDPGVLLASPGPSLSGLMFRELGLPEQIEQFYTMIREQHMRTFFALTEPEKGSDANHIQTKLSQKNKQYYLNGTKAFFGNGVVAGTGIVLAKIAESPVGIRAVWISPEILKSGSITKSLLPIFALRGSQISQMQFCHTNIPYENILGHHRSACESGLLGILKVFNQLRTGVGALAIGQAQAVYDICYLNQKCAQKNHHAIFSELNYLLISARTLLHQAAKTVDQDPFHAESVAIAKINATQTAERVIEQCIQHSATETLIENPWLLKSLRDVYCWEYMEGTTAMQKKQIKKNWSLYA